MDNHSRPDVPYDQLTVPRETLERLVVRARRAESYDPSEVRAVADADDLLARSFADAFPVTDGPEQLTLFDRDEYLEDK